jgi:DeoR/GlpR family transcriptional regulator of sugar metabolism
MTNKQRLELIERFVREKGYVDLHTLAKRFDISVSTVRRALNELDARGTVRRHHGGASIVESEGERTGYDFITQDDRQAAAKHAIAERVAEEIEPGMTVLLDGGTTTYALARVLVSRRLQVITNSLPIAALFSEIGSSDTIVTGGTVYARLGILYGPTCELALEQMHADIAVLGAAGVTPEGIWNANHFVVSVQKRIMAAADRCLFAVDHSKFGKRALNLTTKLSPDFRIVTDRPVDAETHAAAREAGCELVLADPVKE